MSRATLSHIDDASWGRGGPMRETRVGPCSDPTGA